MIERLEDLNLPMEKLLDELMDGDIIVFQRDEEDLSHYPLPTPKEYFRYLEEISNTFLDMFMEYFFRSHFFCEQMDAYKCTCHDLQLTGTRFCQMYPAHRT